MPLPTAGSPLSRVQGSLEASLASEIYLNLPRPSSYPLLGPKYLLSGTIYPQLRVQGGSWYLFNLTAFERTASPLGFCIPRCAILPLFYVGCIGQPHTRADASVIYAQYNYQHPQPPMPSTLNPKPSTLKDLYPPA